MYIYIYIYINKYTYIYIFIYIYLYMYPPKGGEIALGLATNGEIADFQYCLVVFSSLLRLLSTDILV